MAITISRLWLFLVVLLDHTCRVLVFGVPVALVLVRALVSGLGLVVEMDVVAWMLAELGRAIELAVAAKAVVWVIGLRAVRQGTLRDLFELGERRSIQIWIHCSGRWTRIRRFAGAMGHGRRRAYGAGRRRRLGERQHVGRERPVGRPFAAALRTCLSAPPVQLLVTVRLVLVRRRQRRRFVLQQRGIASRARPHVAGSF
jgi:hypothetical protein